MRWMWIDRILELEKGQRCIAVKNVSLAEEHLHDHFAADESGPAVPVMPAPLIIEGMAQTAGILVGHARDFGEKVILAKIGKATLDRDVFPGQTLLYTASLEAIDDTGGSTSGIVEVVDHAAVAPDAPPSETSGYPGAERIGTISLLFSHIDHNRAGTQFPEHNFVFTDQFMDLMRNSGFG